MDFIIEEAEQAAKLVGTEITFCGTRWFIAEIEREHPKLDGDDGVCDFDTQTIYINEELHTHRKKLAVTHELLHVACESVGIEDDEELIRRIEHRIYELVQKFPSSYK